MSHNPAYDTPYTAIDGAPDHIQTLHAYPWLDGLDEYFDELVERGWLVPTFMTVHGGAGAKRTGGPSAPAVTWTPPAPTSPPVMGLAASQFLDVNGPVSPDRAA